MNYGVARCVEGKLTIVAQNLTQEDAYRVARALGTGYEVIQIIKDDLK